MVFYPPAWVPKLPMDIPDSVPLEQFMIGEEYGRYPLAKSRNPYTCGLTGKSYSWAEMTERTDGLARAIGKRFGWQPNEGTPWDKVMAVFSYNTTDPGLCCQIDYFNALYAVHRFSGIATPANAAYSALELQHQLTTSAAQGVFTCVRLLATTLQATRAVGIPDNKVFLLDLPALTDADKQAAAAAVAAGHATVDQLKAVMVSHYNVIANVMQLRWYESVGRKLHNVDTQVEIGLLPFSHIYGLVVIAHAGSWRGDEIIVLPRFELASFLTAIQKFRIQQLRIVPPILIRLLRTQDVCSKYDLSSVRFVYTGAAPTGEETIADLKKIYPSWTVAQGYGMTETSTVVCSSSEHDAYPRSSGSLVPGAKAKIIGFDGKEVTTYDTPGELLVQSPTVVLGYLNNEKATAETFVHHDDGRWIRTGDEVLVTRAPASGNEHLVIVDRIKELIKVKGHQVAPAELEAHLLTHPAVLDTAVIQTPDESAGEVPKAFVVKSAAFAAGKSDEEVARAIVRYVEEHKSSYKWLKGGVEFIDAIPKSPSGKILRRLLRDQERAKARKAKSKL
ncbi:phenylacetyl-ligase [Niveomyces insectorum RCEF 264]|uniref:Phenylacetyl-ligase n=1 Tax=Niveomyces insectorum RCEF 264 TaxID=1081102 RepID=A0A167UJ49_9HYPO|nr:phenylacetyl-ligase [Niveomyces insectorum RCEF 264]